MPDRTDLPASPVPNPKLKADLSANLPELKRSKIATLLLMMARQAKRQNRQDQAILALEAQVEHLETEIEEAQALIHNCSVEVERLAQRRGEG